MKAIIPTLALVIGLLDASVFAADTKAKTGTVWGVVFTADVDGGRSVVPGAKISLIGPATRETEADAAGKYVFDALPPGSYDLKAQAPGMIATHTLAIAVGTVSEAPLEMKVDVVSASTTVTATADALGTEEAAGSNSVGGSAVNNVPNLNERFEGLLPLIPGVVRGPNGVINMNGARSSQSGSLVNSADVSDPATGATAINIPIDVVSSVQVFSTPYNPEYGRFTGAVSDVETHMAIGFFRSSGQRSYLVWGVLLFLGAVASFLTIGLQRHQLTGGRPEQYLGIWQTQAGSRPSNPLLYVGRNFEFVIRRCFLPYALLFFALLNITKVAFVLSAIGANVVWPIALYSYRTFAGVQTSTVASPAPSA